jgi:hypothetical protein
MVSFSSNAVDQEPVMAQEQAQPWLQAKPLRAILAVPSVAVSAGCPLHEKIVLLPFPRRARVH